MQPSTHFFLCTCVEPSKKKKKEAILDVHPVPPIKTAQNTSRSRIKPQKKKDTSSAKENEKLPVCFVSRV